MHRHFLTCCLVMWTAAALVSAQGGPPPIDIVGVEPLEFGEVVAGVPFTAEAVTEMTQELADGNRIERRSNSTIVRDGAGRVRREQALPPIGPVVVDPEVRMITISDPRQRVLYMIDPGRRTVSKSTMPPGPPRQGRPPGDPPRGDGPRGGRSRLSPPRVVSENLGNRQIAGVRAEGTRQTMTFPAGAFGNVRPIDVVTERWYSPDLKIVVESRRSDPRMGDVFYQVVNLVRAEPPAELFDVPADYTLIERPPRPGFARPPRPPN